MENTISQLPNICFGDSYIFIVNLVPGYYEVPTPEHRTVLRYELRRTYVSYSRISILHCFVTS